MGGDLNGCEVPAVIEMDHIGRKRIGQVSFLTDDKGHQQRKSSGRGESKETSRLERRVTDYFIESLAQTLFFLFFFFLSYGLSPHCSPLISLSLSLSRGTSVKSATPPPPKAFNLIHKASAVRTTRWRRRTGSQHLPSSISSSSFTDHHDDKRFENDFRPDCGCV